MDVQRIPNATACAITALLAGAWAITAATQEEPGASLVEVDLDHRTSSIRPKDGYLVEWYIAGPFSSINDPAQARPRLADVDPSDDTVQLGDEEALWKKLVLEEGTSRVRPAAVGVTGPGVVLAHAEIYVNRDMQVQLHLLSQAPIGARVNGEWLALNGKRDEGETGFVGDVRLVKLRMGFNELLVVFGDGENPFGFSAQVLKADGQLIEPPRLWIVDDQILMERPSEPVLRRSEPR